MVSNLKIFYQNHLICLVPEYCNTNIKEPVKVQVYVQTQYKEQFRTSPTMDFTYMPVTQRSFNSQTRTSDPSPVRKLIQTTSVIFRHFQIIRNEPTMRLQDIGKTDSFDRMINDLKYSVDQMTNSGTASYFEALLKSIQGTINNK